MTDPRLLSLVQRVERIDEDIAELTADKAEVMKEAKSAGYDLAALRLVLAERRKMAKDAAAFATLQSIAETYRGALGMLVGTPLGNAALGRLADDLASGRVTIKVGDEVAA
jgi:uncharacterized protein (UPF0335 family)